MSRSVTRALTILTLFSREKQEWGITEISLELQLPKSTVHGLVKTLEQEQFLAVGEAGRYRLGIKVFALGMAYAGNVKLTTAAEPAVRALTEKYQQTVHVAIYAGNMAVMVVVARAGSMGIMAPRVGAGIAAYCTGVGKVLLAYQSPQHIEEYLGSETLVPITRNTITEKAALRQELEQIRQQGYGMDQGEALLEIGCIAAPIFSVDGQVIAAISISGPLDSVLDEKVFKRVRQDTLEAAQMVSAILGYRR
ncbi:MAG: IclR family transcriptional regulator [Methylocystaceae bacterium]